MSLRQRFEAIKNNSDYRRLTVNIASLFTIQVSNYLIPLITFPYLVRTLGIEGFGLVAFAQNIFSYFEQLMTYSFALTAPRDISQSSNDRPRMSRIFHTVLFTKLLLLAASLVAVSILTLAVPRLWEFKNLMGAGSLILLANAVQIDWFFQGIQAMKNITVINLTARFLSVFLLFAFVHSPNDNLFALIALPVSNILAGGIAFGLVYRRFRLPFQTPQYLAVLRQLRDGWQVFLSQFLVRFYSSDINITILGFLTDNLTLGIYSFANRIYALVVAASAPISAATYPYLARLFEENYAKYQAQFRWILKTLLLVFALGGVLLFVSADFLTTLIAGAATPRSALILRILAVAIVFTPFAPFYTQAFFLHRKEKWLLFVVAVCIVVNAISLVAAYYFFQEIGLAVNCVIVQMTLCFLPLLIFRRLKIM